VALIMHHAKVNAARAKELLIQNRGSLRAIVGDLDFHELD
jgi:DNA-binding protein Fis